MIYKHKFIMIQHIWFYEETSILDSADMVTYHQVKNKINGAKEFYTLLIDLNKSEDEIFSSFSKSNRKEIRKSIANDNLKYKMYHQDIDNELLKQFFIAHNKFTQERSLNDISFAHFKAYNENNELYISTISTIDDQIISWRVHIANKDRVRALVSNSFFHNKDKELRNLIGRASRVMRWNDILYFKKNNFKIYDFGGWYNGKEDKKKLFINQYKESFSKITEKSYNYSKCITLKCYTFKLLLYIKGIIT